MFGGAFQPIHWLLVLVVLLLMFGGKGKISDLMGDFAKGVKSFKKGMADEPETISPVPQIAPAAPVAPAPQPTPTEASRP